MYHAGTAFAAQRRQRLPAAATRHRRGPGAERDRPGRRLAAARERAYDAVARIYFDGMQIAPTSPSAPSAPPRRVQPVLRQDEPSERSTRWRRRAPRSRAFEGMEQSPPLVGIVMGSENDGEVCSRRATRWTRPDPLRGPRDVRAPDPDQVASTPDTHARGLKVIIAGAGEVGGTSRRRRRLHGPAGDRCADQGQRPGRARLVAPLVQMPPGVPVACVAIDGARNAAILAAKILDV